MSLISYNDIKKKFSNEIHVCNEGCITAVVQNLVLVNVPGTSHIQKFVMMLRSKPIPVF